MATGSSVALTERARLVIAHVDADRDVGREADEPGILGLVGRAGLARDRFADFLYCGRRARLNNALQHRSDLVGRHRIQHLLATVHELGLGLILPAAGRVAATAFALVVLEDGV